MKVTFNGFDMPKTLQAKNQIQSFLLSIVIIGVIAFLVDYITLPAYNIHDIGFLTLLVIYLFIFVWYTLFCIFSSI